MNYERMSDFPEWMHDDIAAQCQALMQVDSVREQCQKRYQAAIERGMSEKDAVDEAQAYVEKFAITLIAKHYEFATTRPKLNIRIRNWFRRTFIKKYKYAYAHQKGDKQWRIFP